jgi:hypothetical protein
MLPKESNRRTKAPPAPLKAAALRGRFGAVTGEAP